MFELPDTHLDNRILILSQFDKIEIEKSASIAIEAETLKVWPPAAPYNN